MTITEQIIARIEELGNEDAAKFFESDIKLIEKWKLGKTEPNARAAEILLTQAIKEAKPKGGKDDLGLGEEPDPSPESLIASQLKAVVPDVDALLTVVDLLRPKVRLENPANATATEILQAVLDGRWTRRAVMMMPCNKDINPNVLFNVVAIFKKNPWLGFQYKTNTILQRARNLLVQDFMNSEAEWSIWMDSDMLLPFGEPGFFYNKLKAKPENFPPEFASYNAIQRLQSHGKTIVGAVYARRQAGESLCIQPHLTPRHAGDKALVDKLHRGPFNDLVEVDYVATGCVAVHRQVYLDLMAKMPELAPKAEGEPWDFFGHDVGKQGEDMYFCELAKKAGHQSYLDCGLFCGHLGIFCFMP